MKKLITLILAGIFTFSCSKNFNLSKPAEEKIEISQEFVQGSQDIPLISEMTKTADDAIDFDSNSGSIISSSYISTKNKEEIKDFYSKSLPELGWSLTNENDDTISFKRENAELEIEFATQNQQQIVTFFISSSL